MYRWSNIDVPILLSVSITLYIIQTHSCLYQRQRLYVLVLWFSGSVHIYRSKARRKQQNMFWDIKITIKAQMEWKCRRTVRSVECVQNEGFSGGSSESFRIRWRVWRHAEMDLLFIKISIHVQMRNMMFASERGTHTNTSNSRNTPTNLLEWKHNSLSKISRWKKKVQGHCFFFSLKLFSSNFFSSKFFF